MNSKTNYSIGNHARKRKKISLKRNEEDFMNQKAKDENWKVHRKNLEERKFLKKKWKKMREKELKFLRKVSFYLVLQ